MNEMIERVVHEMQRYDLEPCNDGTFHIIDGYDCTVMRSGLTADDEPEDILDEMNARAAIAAMREATDNQARAGYEESIRFLFGGFGISSAGAKAVWRAMIDEALKE